MSEKVTHTPGPWPMQPTGDGKRIVIGRGLVEGPNGYEVAEVYSDDCPYDLAEANARLIAAAPDLLAALKDAERILSYFADGETSFSGPGTPKTVRDAARAALTKAEGHDNG